ncbi:type VI secretion system protein TssL, long form [Phenylobacterium sp.]|uniref:type VI secretion system protein TssL, long form n=1 Tax=Phenylobacterium sp. TaxID=1871053 RepID=UPI00286C580F|nr:type VI secretion system protein TssL, long form [Phenylobacterium sp.]
MSGKDPFSFGEEEGDRTVIGGRAAPPDAGDRTMIGPSTARPAFAPRVVMLEDLETTGNNPLLAAAAPLITLVNALRSATQPGDIGQLRQTVIDELRRFQQVARARAAPDDEVRHGHYALCALIDEVVLSTPWGSKSAWPKQSLVATFHNEVVSGDRMLEIAEALEARPNRSPNLLELIYLCLSFGFEGRLRLETQGANRLFQMRERIYNAIRQVRGAFERALSPKWRGVDAGYQPIAKDIPLWVFGAAFATLALLVYAGFLFSLSSLGDRALKPLTGLYRAGAPALNRTAPPPVVADSRLFLTILDILKPDIDAGRVAVTDSPDAVLVRLKDKGLFASGSAQLDADYGETIARLAQAIDLTVGTVAVTGHTDNQRIRSLQFASNQELSEARANGVIAQLTGRGIDEGRLSPTGLGESQPVAGNEDPDGRRQNRRVEVTIPKTYAAGAQP